MLAIEHEETVKKPSPRTVSGPSESGRGQKREKENDEMMTSFEEKKGSINIRASINRVFFLSQRANKRKRRFIRSKPICRDCSIGGAPLLLLLLPFFLFSLVPLGG